MLCALGPLVYMTSFIPGLKGIDSEQMVIFFFNLSLSHMKHMKLIQDVPFIKMITIYSRLSLIRISKGGGERFIRFTERFDLMKVVLIQNIALMLANK